MGCGGLHRQAGGTGPAATRASHPLPRRIRPERESARAGDAIGARQAACGRCGASGRKRPRRAAQPRAEAPCDELGATAQAGLFHRRHHLRPLRRRGTDRRQHRGTHRHPRHPRPLREARRAGASALPARSARPAAGRVTRCRPLNRKRKQNPIRCGHDPAGLRSALCRDSVRNGYALSRCVAPRCRKPTHEPPICARSVPKAALARPLPTCQTRKKGRLNFLYPKISDINIPYFVTEEFNEGANITTQVPVVYILESMGREIHKLKQ